MEPKPITAETQESDLQPQRRERHEEEPQNDEQDDIISKQQEVHREEKEEQNIRKTKPEEQNHVVLNPLPTMYSSSSPPKTSSPLPPYGSPPLFPLSMDKNSYYSYVFQRPEVKLSKPSSPPVEAVVEESAGGSEDPDEEAVKQVKEDGVIGGGSRIKVRPNLSILKRAKTENLKKRVLLGSRIFGFLFCLISFSVMAVDKDRGWALDSFHLYKEFRYCIAVNVIGFVYSGLQAFNTAHSLITGKYLARDQLRCLLDFSLDQVLAYLLLSASSSAAFRVEEWESNWGKDEFPTMARASVSLSFLAFVAFALSSLVSGYTLFIPNSM